MVYIPEDDRGTLCISSQVGCALDCTFCSTAQQGFNRNLTAAEIVGQVLLAQKGAGLHRPATIASSRNVVLMGMGEPLANFRNVVPAHPHPARRPGLRLLAPPRDAVDLAAWCRRSTSWPKRVNVALAVSLHAPDDELRSELVPINRKHPIAELLEACWHYIDEQNGRSVTFEYVMLDGVNDSVPRRRARWRGCCGASGQGQSHSLQSVSGHAVPALTAGSDPDASATSS